MRRALAVLVCLSALAAFAASEADVLPGQAPGDSAFDYPETIVRAADGPENAVTPANFDADSPLPPLRLVVRFHRGANVEEAINSVMSQPAARLVDVSSGDVSVASASTISSLDGVREVRRLTGVIRAVAVELPGSFNRDDTIAAFKAMPEVADVEEEGVVMVQLASVAAVGGISEVQPGLLRTGLAKFGSDAPLVQPTVDNATSVIVAVVDTGVDRTHPDLNVAGGHDFTADNDFGLDGNGHGTHVAGIIGAYNNGNGVVGALPGAPIWSLKVLSATGKGTTTGVVDALNWVVENGRNNGIRVVNLSLSGPRSAMMCDAIRAVVLRGITVVAAAGNNGLEISSGSPSDCAHALVVTAIADYDGKPGGLVEPPTGPGSPTTKDDTAARFSNYAASRNARVVAAPGVHVLSTVPEARCGPLKCAKIGPYARLSGTSMAAPLVSGIAALCYNSGTCTAPRSSSASVLYDAFTAANRDNKAYGFTGDPYNAITGRFYGYLASNPY